MRKIYPISAFFFLLFVISNGLSLRAQDFARGTGTAADPFHIKTAEHLDNVRKYLGPANAGKHFRLMNDIDLTAFLNGKPEGWEPIGYSMRQDDSYASDDPAFGGVFDGGGYTISGLYINRQDKNAVGLFGYIYGATIRNLNIIIAPNKNVAGKDHIGGLVGFAWISQKNIQNCHITGSVKGQFVAGGLIGSITAGTVYNCSATKINVEGSVAVGGLIGVIWNGDTSATSNMGATRCYSRGTVKGETAVGGLVGSSGCYLLNCYTDVNVEGNEDVGGLVGALSSTYAPLHLALKCYSTGTVSGRTNAGGLVGNLSGCIMEMCVAANELVMGGVNANRIAGTIGSAGVLSSNHAYDGMLVNNSKITGGQGSNPSGFDKTAKELYTQETYSAWDFDTVWKMPGGVNDPCDGSLPILQWQRDESPVKINGANTGLEGTYTIGLKNGNAKDFPSFDEAQAAINSCGIMGDVTFLIASGTYSLNNAFYIDAQAIKKSDVHTLRIEGMAGGATLKLGKTEIDHIVVSAALNTTITNLNIWHDGKTSGGGITYAPSTKQDTLHLTRLQISGCRPFTRNSAIAVSSGRVGIVEDCSFSNNTGGAIYSNAPLLINRSTFSGNQAGEGAAIIQCTEKVCIANSTLYGNEVGSTTSIIDAGESSAILFSTIINNKGVFAKDILLYIRGSIIMGNAAFSNQALYSDPSYFNLYDENASFNNVFGTSDPVLTNNGGYTPTCMIKEGSQAINKISKDIMRDWETAFGQPGILAHDQCEKIRPQNELACIGAVERFGITPKLDLLTASNNTLSPLFDSDTASYTANIRCGESEIELCFATQTRNRIRVDGVDYGAEGCVTAAAGAPGSRQDIEIVVENESMQTTYRVSVGTPFPSTLIYQAYNNMIEVVANPALNGGYAFVRNAYQWHTDSDGQPMPGKTSGVLYMPQGFAAGESYSVDATLEDGTTRRICSFTPQKISSQLKAYPNPVASTLHIETGGTAAVKEKVEIYNISGVWRGSYPVAAGRAQIDMSAYPSGIYVLKINGETIKIVKR